MSEKSMRTSDILAIYAKYGSSMSIRRLTQLCWEEGIFAEEERRNMAFRAAMRICREALKTLDATKLPQAVPTPEKDEDGGQIWKQKSLLEYPEAKYYLGILIRQEYADEGKMKHWANYMLDRWEDVPPYPTLAYPEDQPRWWIQDKPEDDDEFDAGYTKDPDDDDDC